MRKTLIFFILIGIFQNIAAQNPYDSLSEGDKILLGFFLPITTEKSDSIYKDAVQLMNKNYFMKAGQIFDRLYWLDTAAGLGKMAFVQRKKIENKIKEEYHKSWTKISFKEKFFMDTCSVLYENKKIEIDLDSAFISLNDAIEKRGKIKIEYNFDWFINRINSIITFSDTGEKFIFILADESRYNTTILNVAPLIKRSDENYYYGEFSRYIHSDENRAYIVVKPLKLIFPD